MKEGDTITYYSGVYWNADTRSHYLKESTGILKVLKDESAEVETDGVIHTINREDIKTLGDMVLEKALENEKLNLRKGQALMNALHHVDPTLYKEITNTDADCFYDDTKTAKFWDKVWAKHS